MQEKITDRSGCLPEPWKIWGLGKAHRGQRGGASDHNRFGVLGCDFELVEGARALLHNVVLVTVRLNTQLPSCSSPDSGNFDHRGTVPNATADHMRALWPLAHNGPQIMQGSVGGEGRPPLPNDPETSSTAVCHMRSHGLIRPQLRSETSGTSGGTLITFPEPLSQVPGILHTQKAMRENEQVAWHHCVGFVPRLITTGGGEEGRNRSMCT